MEYKKWANNRTEKNLFWCSLQQVGFFLHWNKQEKRKWNVQHFQLKFNINNLKCYNLWARFVALSTKCAYAYVSIKLKWVWLKFPSRKINEIFIWKFVVCGCVHSCIMCCVCVWFYRKNEKDNEKKQRRTQLYLTFVAKWAVKHVSSICNGNRQRNNSFVRQHAEIMANTKQSNLILFNNISADFTQINWIRKVLSSTMDILRYRELSKVNSGKANDTSL